MATAAEPDLACDVIRMAVDVNITLVKEAAKRGADGIVTGDDWAAQQGPLMGADSFDQIIAPEYNRFVAAVRDSSLWHFKHTDGRLDDHLLGVIRDAGTHVLDPLDVDAALDPAHVKEVCPDMALKGGVSCGKLLTFAKPGEVIRETRRIIQLLAPGGRYIGSSSNTIHSGVSQENFLAMMHAFRTHGVYPIDMSKEGGAEGATSLFS